MKIRPNPFYLKGYNGAEYFCDRGKEAQSLINNAHNGINTTLLSIRRMGKTGLIHHVISQLEKDKKWKGIYVDIYATNNLAEFTNQLATAILRKFPQQKSIGKRFLELIKDFSPVISYDALIGLTEVSFFYNTIKQYENSLKGLLQFLEKLDEQILISFDEFQQISKYPEKNIEALLRSFIQSLKKNNFIFSGGHKHLLIEMFSSAKRPFF